jgi:hypothetical protein
MITKFARLEFELFTKPSKLDFQRSHFDEMPEHAEIFYVNDNNNTQQKSADFVAHRLPHSGITRFFTKPSMIDHVHSYTPD